MSLRIIHFSDFHLSNSTHGMECAKTRIHFLVKSLAKIQMKDKKSIDLVIFTGDLLDRGGCDFTSIKNGFMIFKEIVIKPLVEKLGLDKSRFVFLPGNHDTESSGKKNQRNKKNLLDETPHTTGKEINTMMNVKGIDYDGMTTSRTKCFKEFERDYFHDFNDEHYYYGDFQSNFVYKINGISIGITALNSVWLYGSTDDNKKDIDKIYLGYDQIVNSIPKIEQCDLKIVASHFRFESLTKDEREGVYELIAKNYDISLAGHTHSSHDEYRFSSSGGHFLDITSSGTLDGNSYENNELFKNSFQVIDYLENDDVQIRIFRQENGTDFMQNMNFNNGTGVWRQPYNENEAKDAERRRLAEEKDRRRRVFLKEIHPFLPIDIAIAQDKQTFESGDFIKSDIYKKCIDALQNPKNKKVRLMALSGMGKTRTIGESFKGREDVYYSPISRGIESGLHFLMRNIHHGVIVIDNCPIEHFQDAEMIIDSYGKEIRVVSVINILTKAEAGHGQWEFILDNEKNDDVIDGLIKHAEIGNYEIMRKIKEYSGGISLMAIELIRAYHSMGQVKILPDKQAWLNRLLDSSKKISNDTRAVLDIIAMFNPLGFSEEKSDELSYIINNPTLNHITESDKIVRECFVQTIREFQERKLLDMRANSVNVRPRPLAEWLAEEWLQKTPNTSWPNIIADLETAGSLGERLARQMQNRLRSMTSEEAIQLFDKLNEIPFHDEKIVLTKTGSQFIFSMSTVSQVAVAHNLFSLFEEKTTDYLQEKISGDIRRNLVWALEESCVNAEAFEEACKLLSMLAVAENEEISNNATGILIEKFHVILSGTQADLGKRENIMQFLFDKGLAFYSLLVKAINNAFETRSNYHMLTYTERKFDIKSKTSVDISELRHYWTFCKDLLIKMSEDDASLKEIYKVIPNHVYDLVNNGCEDILFDMIGYFAPKYNNDWDEMRKFLGMIKHYNSGAYERSKQYIDSLINNVLAPKTFMKKVKAAMDDIDREKIGSDNINVYIDVMRPYGEEFIEKKIYNSKEFGEMADNDNPQIMWMILTAVQVMNKTGCRDEVYASFMRHIESKPKDYRSGFIESYMCHDKDKTCLASISERLLVNGYYLMACNVLGMIDDNNYGQLRRIFGMIHEGKIPSTYINNYLLFITFRSIDDIFRVSDMLFNNKEVDKVEVAYHHLFQYLWTMKEDEIRPYLPKYEQRLLEFDFNGDKPYCTRQVVEHIESILKTFNEPDFAKKVNNIVMEFSKTYRSFGKNPFENLYLSLLPKYQDAILDDVIEALAAPVSQSLFYLNMYLHLGSGFGYGAGPLFQCDNEKLKTGCEKYPDTLPERFASMCPICNFDKDGKKNGLSDFFLWLTDNYGDDEKVLQSFSSNLDTYSYTGVGSMKGYYVNRREMFKPLFLHKNPNVVKWAKSVYKSEGQQADYQQMVDDYIDMTDA